MPIAKELKAALDQGLDALLSRTAKGEVVSEQQRDVRQAVMDREGVVLRSGGLLYTLMHHGWRNGVEEFRNRLMVRIERDNSVPDDEYEATIARLAVALNGWQPIETAPRPVVGITPYNSEAWTSFLVWCPENLCQYLVVSRGEQFSVMGGGILDMEPTHWMPRIPAPDAHQPGE